MIDSGIDATHEDFAGRVMAVNVKSIYWTAHHIVPHFRERGGGVFVNVASTAGIRPRPGLVWYNASKGAVIALTRDLACQWAGRGITVNAIAPGFFPTRMTEGVIAQRGDRM